MQKEGKNKKSLENKKTQKGKSDRIFSFLSLSIFHLVLFFRVELFEREAVISVIARETNSNPLPTINSENDLNMLTQKAKDSVLESVDDIKQALPQVISFSLFFFPCLSFLPSFLLFLIFF